MGKALTKEESKTFLELLEEIPEHRKGNAIRYKLSEVLFIGIFAILCGANTYTPVYKFLGKKEVNHKKNVV